MYLLCKRFLLHYASSHAAQLPRTMYPQPSRSLALALAPLLVAGCDSAPTIPVSANCDSGGIVGLGVGQTAEFQGLRHRRSA